MHQSVKFKIKGIRGHKNHTLCSVRSLIIIIDYYYFISLFFHYKVSIYYINRCILYMNLYKIFYNNSIISILMHGWWSTTSSLRNHALFLTPKCTSFSVFILPFLRGIFSVAVPLVNQCKSSLHISLFSQLLYEFHRLLLILL